MDWVYLGHAMWLARVGELRLLFDPLLDGRHHGGVFEVEPQRRLDLQALRADFIIVSHRHPDHFDVPSLRTLAELDADSVVITSDGLVERCAQELGFSKVARVDAWQRIELDGGTALLTTPSRAEDIEWGVMVGSEHGVAWNQVDTVHRNAAEIRQTLERAAVGLSAPSLTERIELALVRWQPMLEVQALLGERTAFPFEDYAGTLAQIAALNAAAIVPAACGTRHRGPGAWMNEYVFPVSEPRALRDITARCPNARALPAKQGACYRVHEGQVSLIERDAEALLTPCSQPQPERYLPFAGPPLCDPNLDGRDEHTLRARITPWIRGELADALTAAYPSFDTSEPLCFAAHIVYPSATQSFQLKVSQGGCAIEERRCDDYDMLNVIAASQLADVLDGRRHWGEPLLGGLLRASHRAYRVTPQGLEQLPIGLIFFYYALSYERSHERWVDHQLRHPSV